jgi:hypothetical protein
MFPVVPRAEATAPAPPIAWTVITSDVSWPDVAPAPGGGVYIATADNTNTGALVRLDSSGAQIWRQTVPAGRPMTTVASDSAGNALLAGYKPSSPFNAYLLKYNSAGALQWTQTISSPLSDWPTGVGVDPAGNAYFAEGPWATNYGVPPAGTYSTLRRFNADGQVAWINSLNTLDGTYPGNGAQMSDGTVVGHDGYVYSMFSNYSREPGNVFHFHSYLSKTSQDGQQQWIKPLGELTNVFAIGVDSNNNIYAALSNTFKKYDSDGNEVWSITNNTWSLSSLAVGPQNEIFVAGHADGGSYVAQYDVDGVLQWNDIQPIAPLEDITYMGLAVSGNKLIAAAPVAEQGVYTNNLIRAYQLVPEPASGTLLIGLAIVQSMFWPRRGRHVRPNGAD